MSKYVVNPVEVRMQESEKGTVYQSIVAMGFRARQINDDIKSELSQRLADITPMTDENEGINFDQMAISREFDKIPKPTFLAMQEIKENKLKWTLPQEENNEQHQ